ncbi:ATP-binding protein [Solibacillus sp. CAU 1738]|uniref:ATP-binding protein n=1 Tax=Solibacillus sp. CAU 1738 TaxID=3140363 RepID=UPI00325FFBF7
MADRIAVAKKSDIILETIRTSTKLEYGNIAKLALSYSLKKTGHKVTESLDRSGREIRRSSIFSDDREELLFQTITQYVHQRSFEKEDFINYRSIVKDHVDNGCQLLQELYNSCNSDATLFFQRLILEVDTRSLSNYNGIIPSEFPALKISIGTHPDTRKPVVLELNNTNKFANPNLAIAGKSGVGKTQFLLKLLADIRIQSRHKTNFIYIDYKGDTINNTRFLQVTRANVFNPFRKPMPINPFILPEYTSKSIKMSAVEKADSFSSIDNKIGSVQRGILEKAIEEAYRRRTSGNIPYPDFQETNEILNDMYIEEGKKADSLLEIMNHLANFQLFWSHEDDDRLVDSLHKETFIVDLHELPVLKELAAYLVIERLYKEMTNLDDSPIEEGYRHIRTVLVIDEAHNYLSQRNPFLEKIIREGRSKGIAVFFASQSPNDYNQKDFDFKELLEFMFIFSCDGASPNQLQEMLGLDSKTSKDLSVELSHLTKGHVFTKDFVDHREYLRFEADAFRFNY